ncbi:MAG: EamA family transporter [Chloroflexi bacterium]|jgi:drug/metabolite transporter (DMT)-like permease|nr:EamA family transporter [Chloroflexota bacterium]MBT5628131.1 EamA family transporter [Chloroflexota bacterium]
MTGLAVVLVLISAVAHASWNLLVRRSEKPELANWMMAGSAAVLVTPVAIYFLVTSPPDGIGWLFIAGTIALHIAYFFTLGRAYKHGDLSIVYPVARGLGLALIPVLGIGVLGESVTLIAGLGIVLIFLGVVTVGSSSSEGLKVWLRPKALLADRGVMFAIMTGILIASYSSLDKRGVEHVEPVFYMFMLQLGGSVGVYPLLRASYARREFIGEIRQRWKIGILGGVLQFTAYGLILSAFRLSPVSYIGPFRELGIVFGVLMAALILKESISRNRIIGAACIGIGATVVAVAP